MTEGRKIRAYVNIPTHLGPQVTRAQTVTNISLSGCFLRTDTQLKIGSLVLINLPLASGRLMQLEGRVVRQHDDPNGYGIGFETLSDEQRRDLALLIAETLEQRPQE